MTESTIIVVGLAMFVMGCLAGFAVGRVFKLSDQRREWNLIHEECCRDVNAERKSEFAEKIAAAGWEPMPLEPPALKVVK
jgi:hypothetical protein